MADTDLRSELEVTPCNYSLEALDRQVAYDINVLDADLLGVESIGSHEIFNVPAGHAIRSITAVVSEAITSDGAATIQFKVNGVLVGSAVVLAALAQGRVIEIPLPATGVVGGYAFDPEVAVPVEMVVGTAVLTGGELIVVPTYLDVTAIVEASDVRGLGFV